ncbi:MAG: PDZ domain-containing protein [Lachnospiraceae bacterium]|nr:PDZ domain-containing protein [Lachnospiraceae bacterium]
MSENNYFGPERTPQQGEEQIGGQGYPTYSQQPGAQYTSSQQVDPQFSAQQQWVPRHAAQQQYDPRYGAQQPYGYQPYGQQIYYQLSQPEAPRQKSRFWPFVWGFLTATVLSLIMVFIGFKISRTFNEITSSIDPQTPQREELEFDAQYLTDEEAIALIQKIDKLMLYIDQYFVDDVDKADLVDGALHGVILALGDRYATYLNEEEFQDAQATYTGDYVGIGVTVMLSDTGVEGALVISVNQSGGAYEVGLAPGDVLTHADGLSLAGMTLNEMVSYIRGEEGTFVDITYMRNGQENTIAIQRRKLKETAVYYEMMDNNIAYISLTDFSFAGSDQMRAALEDMQNQGMEALVLDLRDNGGGLVDACVEIADMFIDTGLVTYIEDKWGNREEYFAAEAGQISVPIVILVNENTASASELLTTCLKDHGKAVTVGTVTYGKGIVQTTFPLRDGTAVKFTTAKYYSPSGVNVQDAGIAPDYEVELPEDVVLGLIKTQGIPDLARDTQLQKALEILMQELQNN